MTAPFSYEAAVSMTMSPLRPLFCSNVFPSSRMPWVWFFTTIKPCSMRLVFWSRRLLWNRMLSVASIGRSGSKLSLFLEKRLPLISTEAAMLSNSRTVAVASWREFL